jgi:hypothetical protein
MERSQGVAEVLHCPSIATSERLGHAPLPSMLLMLCLGEGGERGIRRPAQ